MITSLLSVIIAAAFAVLGLFFRFVLIGYRTVALLCWGAALLILLFLLCRKKRLRRLRVVLIVLLCLGLVGIALLEIPIVRDAHTDEGDADYLIVLGAGLNGTAPSLSLTERLQAARTYLLEHPDTLAVVSGGQGAGEAITEAEAMRRWLTGMGIEPERVIMEPRATSTEENIAYSLDILRERGADRNSIAIVSSEYHLYRAKCIARTQGVENPLGVAARTSFPVLRFNYFVREAFAVAYLRVFGRI
ncbi:MAG: YdcF family protein [Oscillospiraceae bacterium]|nr:YdcF family protein [Oscillospiraceae bacterium]